MTFAFLPEHDGLQRNERHAGLFYEACHDAIDGLVRSFRYRVPEILGRRVAISIFRKVGVHAFAKCFLADVAFHHAQHSCGFVVSDIVEELLDFRGRFGVSFDRARGTERIGPHRVGARAHCVCLKIPFRLPCFHGLERHPGGEAFVEPDVVPPLHGDQIAEPLVRDFVSDQFLGNCFAQQVRGLLWIDKDKVAGDHQTSVFHCTGGEIGDAKDVELAVGILDAEILVVILQRDDGSLKGESRIRFFIRDAANADGDSVGGVFGALPIADRESDEIGRHFRRGCEFYGVFAVARAGRVRNYFRV